MVFENNHGVQKLESAGQDPPGSQGKSPVEPTVRVLGAHRVFPVGGGTFSALANVTLNLEAAELVAIVGASGSGKSTLLNLIAGLDRPTSGEVWVCGHPVHSLNEDALAVFRGRHVGIVFQFFQLLPTLTALENVLLPMDFVGLWPKAERRARARELLRRVGVLDQADKLPAALSGGQQQRVATARALANDPPLLVADEPTGNLDSQTAAEVHSLLAECARQGTTVLVVTHAPDLQKRFGRVLHMVDGQLLPPAAADSVQGAA